jgi:hypothetical protein
MADVFTGTYKVSKREKFGEFLQELGRSCFSSLESFGTHRCTDVGAIKRTLAQTLTPERRIVRDGDEWQVQEKVGLKNREWRFKMGEEFELTGVDDVKRKCIVTEDSDSKWTEVLTPLDSDKNIKVVYEFGEKELVATQTVGAVTAVITYDRR